MKIRKFLQASVHLTTDERKTLESALDLLIELGEDLENLIYDFDGTIPENVVVMDEDVSNARYRLEKILSNIENNA